MTVTSDTLAAEIDGLVARIVEAEPGRMHGYSRIKARALAASTLLIGEAYGRFEITADEMADEMRELNMMAIRFVRHFGVLAATTLERLARAVTRLLFRTLSGMARLPLPPVAAIA